MRWSLGAVLSVVVLCGCSEKKPATKGKRDNEVVAVKLVEKLGGTITRDEKQPDKPVIGVSLSRTKVTDANLKELKELNQLTTLDLGDTNVTNAGLKELKELK